MVTANLSVSEGEPWPYYGVGPFPPWAQAPYLGNYFYQPSEGFLSCPHCKKRLDRHEEPFGANDDFEEGAGI